MQAIAVFGVVTALVGAVVGWRVVGALDRATGDSLEVGIRTLETLDDTVEVADEVLVGATASLGDLQELVVALTDSFATGDAVLEDVASLSATVAPSIEQTSRTLRQLEDLGADIDGLLDAVGSLPLAPAYDPARGLGPTFGSIASDLEPLGPVLRATANDLAAARDDADELRRSLERVSGSLAELRAALDGSGELVRQYRANIAAARAVTVDARQDLGVDLKLARAVIVAVSLSFALGQVVPFRWGRELAAGEVVQPAGDDASPP